MKLNLQLFAGGHSVTVYKDAHMTTASASSTSDVQKNATVTLTLTPASGYEVANVEVISGGVTIYQGDNVTFTMGEENVVLYVTSQATNAYKVVENCFVSVNGTVTNLVRNMTLIYGVNGAIVGVDGTASAISLGADVLANLVASGVIVKDPAWKGEEEPEAEIGSGDAAVS